MPDHFVHIPVPGDHYSPVTASSLITVIYELSRQHHAAGGETTVVVGRGTQEGFPPYPMGRVAEVDFGSFPDRRRRILDILAGRLGLGRPFMTAAYRAGLDAIPRDFDGCVFFHNAPAPIPFYRRRLPNARLALYLHNILLNSYTSRELAEIVDCCDAVICVSRFVTEYLARRLGGECRKASVVLNGVDPSAFSAEVPRPPTEEPLIMYLGRLSPDKGPEILLEAALELSARKAPFRLLVAGGFDSSMESSAYARSFRELAVRLGDRIDLRPFQLRSVVPALYRQADIFWAPSNCDDACPLTLGEAMASGLPCVVSRRGGIPEVGGDAVLYFTPPDPRGAGGPAGGASEEPVDAGRIRPEGPRQSGDPDLGGKLPQTLRGAEELGRPCAAGMRREERAGVMRVFDRDIRRIVLAPFCARHYRAVISMASLCCSPFEFVDTLLRYLFASGKYPHHLRLKTALGIVEPKLYSYHDLLTVNEVFFRQDYKVKKDIRVVVDIGSNIGISALYFLTRNEDVFCYLYEPVPENIAKLQDNLSQFSGRFELRPVAVAGTHGRRSFGIEPTGRYGGLDRPTGRTIEVETVGIADLLAEKLRQHGTIDVLKIDTEGSEQEIIEAIPRELFPRIRRVFYESDDGRVRCLINDA